MKLGKFPDCAGRKHKKVLELGFLMMSEDPKKRAGPKEVLKGLDGITDQVYQEIKKKYETCQLVIIVVLNMFFILLSI